MPIASTRAFEQILMNLSVLRYILKSKSKRGQYDLNKSAENFFRDFLNKIYGWNLINANHIAANYPAIDLADDTKQICVQVTAENDSVKIRETIKSFVRYNLHERYKRLMVFIITEKKLYTADFESVAGDLEFYTKRDVLDVDDLLGVIEKLSLAKLNDLAEFTKREMTPLFSEFAEPNSIFSKSQKIVNRPPKSCMRFFKLLNSDEDMDYEFELKSIININRKISSLSSEAREYLALIVLRGKIDCKYGDPRVAISPQELNNIANISVSAARNFFDVLEEEGLVHYDEGDGERYKDKIIAYSELKSGNEFFVALKKHFGTETEIATIIGKADFTLLD